MQHTIKHRKMLDECYTLCHTFDEFVNTMHVLIKNGDSTVDYEAERWASLTFDIVGKDEKGNLVLIDPKSILRELMRNYKIVDQKSVLASAVMVDAPQPVIGALCYGLTISPDEDDILYLCAIHRRNKTIATIINFATVADKELIDAAVDSYDDLIDNWKRWDLTDPKNPRNLIYALSEGRIEDALTLINNGCSVVTWRNSPINICIEMIKDPKYKDLIPGYKKIMQEILIRS